MKFSGLVLRCDPGETQRDTGMGLPGIHGGTSRINGGAARYMAGKSLLYTVLVPHAPILPSNHTTSFGGCQTDSDRAPLSGLRRTRSNDINGIDGAAPSAESSKQELSRTNSNMALGRSWEGCSRFWDGGGQP